jgi:Protein of unknown function (DUF2541)
MQRLLGAGVAASLLFLFGSSGTAPAQPADARVYLGEANVDGSVDHDNIVVTPARGRFRAIQLRVEKNAIEFNRVIIHFGNGEASPIQIRNRIEAGSETRVIQIPGPARYIQSVEFYYARGNWSGPKPKVRLFGLP